MYFISYINSNNTIVRAHTEQINQRSAISSLGTTRAYQFIFSKQPRNHLKFNEYETKIAINNYNISCNKASLAKRLQ